MNNATPHIPVIVIGGGQAGLSVSYYLQQQGIEHLLLEKKTQLHAWRDQRWDSFCLVTPNWQCALPGHPYDGDDPHGFMVKDEIVAYLRAFADKVQAPIREGVAVTRVAQRAEGGFSVDTSDGSYTADKVVVASGGYHQPIMPTLSQPLPSSVVQLHSGDYRNPAQLPEGAVLVVGSGQSGAQIAEDLHLAGRQVYLAVGNAPRCARFYRGKDVVDWLAEMKYYDMPVTEHPLREGVRDNTNHYVTGRDGGRDIDLRRFAREGMELFGVLEDFDGESLCFRPHLRAVLDEADSVYNNINQRIDQYIDKHGIAAPAGQPYQPVWQPESERTRLALQQAGITAVVWCIGFRPDYSWLQVPVLDGKGYPRYERGVTPVDGCYFIGLPWLHTWGSGRFSGIARDAQYLVEQIAQTTATEPLARRA